MSALPPKADIINLVIHSAQVTGFIPQPLEETGHGERPFVAPLSGNVGRPY